MKIVFVISSLSFGGAERVASILCNEWVKLGHSVDLITWELPGTRPHYSLSKGIRLHQLDQMKVSNNALSFVRNNFAKVLTLRKKLKECQPDIVISFMTNTNILAILSAKMLGIPVLISERTHPGFQPLSKILERMRKVIYPKASCLIVQTQDIADWFHKNIGQKSEIIANPIQLSEFKISSNKKKKAEKELIAIGRLEEEKQFDQLISVFVKLKSKHSEWKLIIYGEGSLRTALENKIRQLNSDQYISLAGTNNNISEVMARSDLVVHCSRYEGFPNVIMEALASGCCIVATDTSQGTRELLSNDSGLLCSSDNLLETLDKAMDDESLRLQYEGKARQAVERYDAPKIANDWIGLAEKIIISCNR